VYFDLYETWGFRSASSRNLSISYADGVKGILLSKAIEVWLVNRVSIARMVKTMVVCV